MSSLNNIILDLIRDRGLSSQDVKDVIAEQVYSAKSSDVEEVYYEAKRLERIFGSKYQQESLTEGYNKKADEFGGYFMSIVMEVQFKVGYSGVIECLQALEYAYFELQKSKQPDMVPILELNEVPTIELNDDGTKDESKVISKELYMALTREEIQLFIDSGYTIEYP